MHEWKNLENRLIFGEDIDKGKVTRYLAHPVEIVENLGPSLRLVYRTRQQKILWEKFHILGIVADFFLYYITVSTMDDSPRPHIWHILVQELWLFHAAVPGTQNYFREIVFSLSELSGRIERREREIALMLDAMDRDAAEHDVITPLTVQQQQQQARPSAQQPAAASPSHGDKRANVFQRLLRALRKRFARQQQQQQQTTTTPDQQRQHQQAIQKRQRTL